MTKADTFIFGEFMYAERISEKRDYSSTKRENEALFGGIKTEKNKSYFDDGALNWREGEN